MDVLGVSKTIYNLAKNIVKDHRYEFYLTKKLD